MSRREEMQEAFSDLMRAYRSARQAEIDTDFPPIVEQFDDVGTAMIDVFGDDPDENRADNDRDSWRRILDGYLEPFMDADWDSAGGAIDLLIRVAQELSMNSGFPETPSSDPCTQMLTLSSGWQGSAAEAFLRHRTHLDVALKLQHEFALALHDVLSIHAEVVEAAHKSAKGVLRRAKEALEEKSEQEWRANKDSLNDAVGLIVVASASYALEGPKGVAGEALKLVGPTISALTRTLSGGTDDIMNGVKDALADLEEGVATEQEHVRKALDDLDIYLSGDFREEFMPLPSEPALRT